MTSRQQRLVWAVEVLLRCKVCAERITPPLVMCRIGHFTCQKCNPASHMCKVCNTFVITDRFVILENLLDTLPRHCKYLGHGCNKIVTSNSKHDQFCLRRPRQCELGKDVKCDWTGSYEEWLVHAKRLRHAEFTFWNAVDNLMFVQYYRFPSKWEFYNMVLNFGSSLFLLLSYKSEEFLHVTVRYLGQNSTFAMQMPEYRMKITFLRDSIKYFSVELETKDDMLAMCEDVPLSDLAPLISVHQELDMYIELNVENLPHIMDLEEA